MASPVDAGRAGTDNGSAQNKACNLPSSIGSGDLLLLILRSAGSDTHTTPTGWTDLVKNNAADASDDVTSIFYRLADQTEGASVTVSCTTNVKFAAAAWRITGAANPALRSPETSTIATGTSATPDPTTVTPTGGSKDYLFLWIGGWEGEQNTGVSPPSASVTNYSNKVGGSSGTAGAVATNCQVAGCSRQNTASSEDPGSWNIVTSDDWTAWAVAVHPNPDTVFAQGTC